MTAVPASFRRSEAVLFRRVRDVVLMLVPADHQVVALGGAGPDLWELLVEPMTFTEAVSRLSTGYGLPPEAIADQVRDVLDRLAAHHVLVAAS